MFIHTESGSIYELDQPQSRVRRLTGNGPPTKRVGDTWREYADLRLEVGQPMIIVWEYIIDDIPVAQSTATSKVIKVEEKDIQ